MTFGRQKPGGMATSVLNVDSPVPSEILESIQDSFFSIDRNWRIVYMNQRALRSNGVEQAQVLERQSAGRAQQAEGESTRAVAEHQSVLQAQPPDDGESDPGGPVDRGVLHAPKRAAKAPRAP